MFEALAGVCFGHYPRAAPKPTVTNFRYTTSSLADKMISSHDIRR